ncbi:hypothetical protein F5Y17DRAFT_264356 [Xylariaceae sp. FL0594]|nr:hypothetical protein F5Y17DRAFT_264356 [Xylariaceae sp. FL0594]
MKGAYSMESARFIDDNSSEETLTKAEFVRPKKRPVSYRSLALHGGLIVLYTIIFVFARLRDIGKYTNHDAVSRHVPSPARSAIKYETKYFTIDSVAPSVYFGEPNDVRERLWDELLEPSNVRLSPEMMRQLGRPEDEGVRLPDGDYIGTLGVYHDLHCLRRIARHFYVDHYFPNMTAEERHSRLMHSQHCLDRIKQTIQCRGDISLATYVWDANQPIPIGNFSSAHECVNWDSLHQWATDHAVNMFEPGLLKHPKFGDPYAKLGGH